MQLTSNLLENVAGETAGGVTWFADVDCICVLTHQLYLIVLALKGQSSNCTTHVELNDIDILKSTVGYIGSRGRF